MRLLSESAWPLAVATTLLLLIVGPAAHAQDSPAPANGTSLIYAEDFNSDSAPDVLVASPKSNELIWFRNEDPRGTFSEKNVISTKVRLTKSVFAMDVDGDGDSDALSASSFDDKLSWYKNTDGYGSFGEQKVFDGNAGSPYSIYGADFTGNGSLDLAFASNENGKTAWCKNEGSTLSEQNVIATNADGARSVHAGDISSNGNIDIAMVASSFAGTNKVSWYRNTPGGFASENIVSQKHQGLRSVIAVDVTQNDNVDLLAASAGDGKIAWYKNTDGYGTFSEQKVITTNAPGVQTIAVADVDGDGDYDVLSASNRKGKIAWYENLDDQEGFSDQKVITSQGNYSALHVADIKQDGDPDVIFISEKKSQVLWSGNQIDEGNGFASPKVIGPK